MKIGIDISQIVYESTGVAKYVRNLVSALIKHDRENEYILFGASLRRVKILREYVNSCRLENKNVRGVIVRLPPTLLDLLWNRLHLVAIEWFTGQIDIFWSSDWTQPPLKQASGITTIHDLTVLRFPESFDRKIVATHKRRLRWAKRECQVMLCDSESTKADVMKMLNVPKEMLHTVYPGY